MNEKMERVVFWNFRQDWQLRFLDFFETLPPIIPCLIHGRKIQVNWPDTELAFDLASSAVGICVTFPASKLAQFLNRWDLELEEHRLVECRLPGDAVASVDARIVKLTAKTSFFDSESNPDLMFLKNLVFFGHFQSFEEPWTETIHSIFGNETSEEALALSRNDFSTPASAHPEGLQNFSWFSINSDPEPQQNQAPCLDAGYSNGENEANTIRVALYDSEGSYLTTLQTPQGFISFINLLDIDSGQLPRTIIFVPNNTFLAIPISRHNDGWRLVRNVKVPIPVVSAPSNSVTN